MSIRKAVIPVAGFGTRFLPATKAVPKNVLPVFDRPSIHFCVEEAAQAGIEEVILVVSRNQEAIPRYFEEWPELESALAGRGNSKAVDEVRGISSLARITCVPQTEQRGLGHAVLMTREAVGDEPFAVFLPDDIIWAEHPTIGDMIAIRESTGSFVLAVKRVPDEAIPNLGIVSIEGGSVTNHKLVGMVEKPTLEEAPSNLAIIGRYVLGTRDIRNAGERQAWARSTRSSLRTRSPRTWNSPWRIRTRVQRRPLRRRHPDWDAEGVGFCRTATR